jgi:hypothetical protein
VVVALTQRVTVDIGAPGTPEPMVFRGGASLILSLGRLNEVEYVVVKNIRSYERFCEQVAFLRGESGPVPRAAAMYGDTRATRIDFNLLHR